MAAPAWGGTQNKPTTGSSGTGPALGGKGSPVASFQKTWDTRITGLKKQGYTNAHIVPIMRADYQRLQTTGYPMSSVEALQQVAALRGQSIMKDFNKPKTGILGDFEQIGSAINPARLGPQLWQEAKATAGLVPAAMEVLGVRKGVAEKDPIAAVDTTKQVRVAKQAFDQAGQKFAKGDISGAVAHIATNVPLARDIPGAYTVAALARGDFHDFLKHPVFHLLDVAPYVGKVGEAAASLSEAPIEAGSAREAFSTGNPYKGIFRSAAGTTETPVSEAGQRAILGGTPRVPRTSDRAAHAAEAMKLDAPTRELGRTVRAETRAGGIQLEKAARANAVKYALTDEQNASLAQALRTGNFDSIAHDPVQAAAYRSWEADTQAKALQGEDLGYTTIIRYHGGDLVYPSNHPVAVAFQNMRQAEGVAAKARFELEHPGLNELEGQPARARQKLETTVTKADTKAAKAKANFEQRLARKPPQSMFGPIHQATIKALEGLVRERLDARGATMLEVQRAMDSLRSGYWNHTGVITKAEWVKAMAPHVADWQEMWDRGIRPIHVPNPTVDQLSHLGYIKPLLDKAYTPKMFETANLATFRPSTAPLAQLMTYEDAELIRTLGTQKMVQYVSDTFGTPHGQIEDLVTRNVDRKRALTEQLGGTAPSAGRDAEIASVMGGYANWSEYAGKYTGAKPRPGTPTVNPADVVIPRRIVQRIDEAAHPLSRDVPGIKSLDKVHHLYKVAVTYSPRFVAHVVGSGAMFNTLEYGTEWIPKMGQALHDVQAALKGEPTMDMRVLQKFNLEAYGTEEVAKFAQHQIIGDTLHKIMGGPGQFTEWWRGKLEMLSNMYRQAAYLVENDKRMYAGLPADAAREQAIEAALKVHMDFDGLAPVEREIITRLFPFYPFTRHILRFMLRYPADHPWRAAFLSNLVEQQATNRKSGLPFVFDNFLFTSGTDASGNATAIDTRPLNPFRSMTAYDPLTLPGVLTAMLPEGQTVLRTLGVNPLSASVNTHMPQQLDPYTGKAVDAHPGFISNVINTYIPEWSGFTHLSDLVKGAGELARDGHISSATYRAYVFQSLGIPFVPFTQNTYDARIKYQNAIYKVAKSAVDQAMYSGTTGPLDQFNLVPFQSHFATPAQVEQLLTKAHAQYPSTKPNAVIPTGALR